MPPVGNHVARCVSLPLVLRNITITGGAAPARAYIEELLIDVLEAGSSPAGCSTAPSAWTRCRTATAPWPTTKP
jgi:hypothetical protein